MKYLLILMLFLLTACASAPKDALTFDEVKIPAPSDGESILVFYRRVSPPTAYEMKVHINDVEKASLPNNAFSFVRLTPGTVTIKTSWTRWSGMPSRSESLEIPANSTIFLELNSSVYTPGGMQFGSDRTQLQSDNFAINVIRDCCKYVDSKP
ncbi:hypothetical protein Q3O59_03010 [Alkalimonas delamerensis]|uniref:Lipoprotein n=1 Tax=Alkalimonas delamerensis TaxID=265981 RepID=A0ABT9GM23_9GAMM|nr:hypothetical protein [Alkalimonas delamerensis]MDP4528001.1 hypothetical protein [Alkalimonas delamerensis]